MENIIRLLNEKGYKITTKTIDNIEFNYCFVDERILFLIDLNDVNEEKAFDYIQDYSITISEHIENNSYRNFFNENTVFSEYDTKIEFFDLRAFLWDLYVIGIRVSAKENHYRDDVKSKILRDKVVARKNIIEEEKSELAFEKIVKEFTLAQELDELISEYKNTIDEKIITSGIFMENFEDVLYEKVTPKINNDLKRRIMKEQDDIKIEDILDYIDKTTKECNDFNIQFLKKEV